MEVQCKVLHERALHAQLADELGDESYGYRLIDFLHVDVEVPQAPRHLSERPLETGTLAWIDGCMKGIPSSMGTTSANAQVDGKLVTADAVVLALGPGSSCTPLISSLTTISGLKSQSIVLLPNNADAISAHALFLQNKAKEGKVIDPENEVYPCGTGEVYVCGTSEQMEVP